MDQRTNAALLILSLIGIYTVESVTNDLEEQLLNFAEGGLRVGEMQGHFDGSSDFSFASNTIDGAANLQQAAELMRAKYASRIEILQNLKSDIETTFNDVTRSNPYTNCRHVRGDEFSAKLKQRADFDEICVAGNGLDRTPSEFLPESLIASWKTTYQRETGLQYIYFGSEEGIIYNYPAVNFDSSDYDPRFRPFYVESVTPEPKDVVIVIDKSGSMSEIHRGKTLMAIANEAAVAVIDTLNANDRVGVVAFSDSGQTPSGQAQTSTCYSDQLAMANAENKEYLLDYVRNIRYGGGTQYQNALTAAFAFFSPSTQPQNDSRERNNAKVIIFLTDGRPNDGSGNPFGVNILDTISTLNARLENKVVIITFGLGSGLAGDSSAQTLLRNMADQTRYNISHGEVTRGRSIIVTNPDNLRSEMATYYNLFLQNAGLPEPTFTIPYQDAFGSGLIASICLPVSVSTELKGVICIDQTFGELLSELTYFQTGESSYSFMVDQYTRVLEHPNIANPTFVTNTPRFTYLRTLETGADIDTMIESIKRGETRNVVTSARKVIARGNTDLEGVNAYSVTTHYYWTLVRGTDYRIGLAIISGDTQATIQLNQISSHFFYHKIALEADLNSIEECAHFSTMSVQDESSIHFSLAAFQEPFQYFYRDESTNDLQRYKTYFTTPVSSLEFKDQVKEYVSATSYFHDLMLNADFETVCIWRYLATENGVLRTFPAVEIPKEYDATLRKWYKQAKANRGVRTITAPYKDAFGAGTILTLAHVLYEGKTTHNPDTDLIVGVMAMDITPAFVYYTIKDNVPDCQTHECFMIDSAGYIITHHQWIESPSFSQNVYEVHISAMESAIANDMLDRNYIAYEACINTTGLRKQYFWRVSVNEEVIRPNYKIYHVDGTNAYVIIKTDDFFSTPTCAACVGGFYQCGFSQPRTSQCFCPCYATGGNIYDYCKGLFDLSSDTDPICTPPIPVVDFESVKKSTTGLDSCYQYNCEAYSSSRDCTSVIGCSWCSFARNGGRLSDPYCSAVDVCPYGIQLTSDGNSGGTNGNKDKKDDGGSSAPIISGVVVVIVVVAIIAIVVGVCIYKRKQRKRQSRYASNSANNTNTVAYNVEGTNNSGYSRDPPTNPSAPVFGNAGAQEFRPVSRPTHHADPPPPYAGHQQHIAIQPGTGYVIEPRY